MFFLFLKAKTSGDTRTADMFGTHVETRTRKDGVVQKYHVGDDASRAAEKPAVIFPAGNSPAASSPRQSSSATQKVPPAIRYTFPADAKSSALRGMTVEGGKPSTIVVDRKPVPGVLFATKVNGQQVFAKLEGRTDLQKLVDDYEAELRGAEMARKAALNAAVPGLDEVMAAAAAAYNEDARYRNEFSAMMEDEGNDGARPPRPLDQSPSQRLQALQEQYPRAALYLRAKRQSESASWADNTGKGAAGRLAMEILASGGDIKDAEAALNARREFVD
jgi:hypothetical protein